jgi:hypothetical protein
MAGERRKPRPKIVVSDDLVVIESGADRIIIPRKIWDAKEKLPNRQQAERHIGRAFAVMEDDPSITNFGLLEQTPKRLNRLLTRRGSA